MGQCSRDPLDPASGPRNVRPTLQAAYVPSYEYGPDVELQHRKIDGGPAFAEVIAADQCPSCRADWTVPGAYRLGHEVGREVVCWACWRYDRARLVRDVRTQGHE